MRALTSERFKGHSMPSAWAGPGIRGRNQVIMSRAELVGIAFAPSPQIKDYVLTEALGSGTYATVYKAIQKGHRSVVAVKCIQRKRLTGSSMENLLTEIKVMKQLDHEYIVKLTDFEWDTNYIYLIMEYCGGGDLSNFIRSRKTLTEIEVKYFLQQLACALQFLRSKGVAHMDLKPQNLLLSVTANKKYVLKVGDFGMAQHLTVNELAESFRGSPLYMAPEIMQGHSYDAKVDLWSVGIILYEALFGEPPFASRTLEELEEKILDTKPVTIPDSPRVSSECADLLQGLLDRDPQCRISFDRFFGHSFIDLDHMPSAQSLNKARSVVKQAVIKDSEGKLGPAVTLYCEALEHFLPALEYEDDPVTKEALEEKIRQYIARAETLKTAVIERRPISRQKPRKLLDEIQARYPGVKSAIIKAHNADHFESLGNYAQALECYETAVEQLIPLIEGLTNREEKLMLKSEVEVYLNRAEELSSTKSHTPQLRDRPHSAPMDSRCKVQ